MKCCKCGAADATFHLTQIMNGVNTTRDYCEGCAPFDMKQRTQQIQSGTFRPEAEWQAKWDKLHAENPEYSREAYEFVHKGTAHYFLEGRGAPSGPHHISSLLEACQDYAREAYGLSAMARLKSWGIETYLDIGEIMILTKSSDLKELLDADRKRQMEEMHAKMRDNLQKKYGGAPFLKDE